MIPEPCKYTPDVSFVNVTFFNISAFVNSWKRCQPCFNGAQKRTAFKEMAHHCNSQNYKCCQKATFLLYWLAPGNTVLYIVPSYMPLSADNVSLHMGNTERDVEFPGLHWRGRRAERTGGQHVSPQPLWWPEVEAEELWELPQSQSQPTATRMCPPSRRWGGNKAHLSYRYWCSLKPQHIFLRLLLLGLSLLQRQLSTRERYLPLQTSPWVQGEFSCKKKPPPGLFQVSLFP